MVSFLLAFLLMKKTYFINLLSILLICLTTLHSPQLIAENQDLQPHALRLAEIQYFLAVDRFDYFRQSFIDAQHKKMKEETLNALKQIRIEDILAVRAPLAELENYENWPKILAKILVYKNPNTKITIDELTWSYKFFMKKLTERYTAKTVKIKKSKLGHSESLVHFPQIIHRSVPKITGGKILLDTDKYISEKTSRAIYWHAIQSKIPIELMIGTEKDFNDFIQSSKFEIIAEISPFARNYNKIFLTFNPTNKKYQYIINQISGNDRLLHLMLQLRLIKLYQQDYFDHFTGVTIYNSPKQFLLEQEHIISDLYARLPEADLVIIGQKGAFENALENASIVHHLAKQYHLNTNNKLLNAKVEKLLKQANDQTAFLLLAASPLKSSLEELIQSVSEAKPDIQQAMHSQQSSHEFTDYLLDGSENKKIRIRLISAVWGDEIIPIAKAIRKSGNEKVIYIGTAGALKDKGLKVGDLVAGDSVFTHSEQEIEFNTEHLQSQRVRKVKVGQVNSPFQETEKWLEIGLKNFDIVEVETGYLREYLGPHVNLKTYFLISDVVGSEHESLASAAASASKRKRSQLKLIDETFEQIKAKNPSYKINIVDLRTEFQKIVDEIIKLKPNRDLFSVFQTAKELQNKKIQSAEEREKLILESKSFDRQSFNEAIHRLGQFLYQTQIHLDKDVRIAVDRNPIFTGEYHPKKNIHLNILFLIDSYKIFDPFYESPQFKNMVSDLKNQFSIELNMGEFDPQQQILLPRIKEPDDLIRIIESEVFKSQGFITELDNTGLYKLTKAFEINHRYRCDSLFLK